MAGALLLAALLARGVAADPQVTASFVPPEGSSLVIRSQEAGGRTLLCVNDVVAALGGETVFDPQTRSFEMKLRQHSAVFGTETSIVVVDTRLVTLSVPVVVDGATAFAELEFFQKVVGPVVGASFAWEKGGRVLSARRADVTEVSVEASIADLESTTKVVFRFSQPPSYKVEKGEDQVVLRMSGVRLLSSVSERIVDDPRVARLVIRPTELAVVLKDKRLSTNVYALGAPPRLVVDVTAPPLAAPPLAPPPTSAPGAPPLPGLQATPAPAAVTRTVMLDPGHGGTELGATGPEGLLEKDATLALVKTIREALTRKGYRVLTTRDTDASVGLDDRAAAANAAKADVFLSIHCNASRAAAAHGTEVYYLSLDASDRAAAAVAELENKAEPTATPSAEQNAALRDLDLILWDLAQNQHLAASARLAEIVQGDFNRLLSITTRGVKQAPFRVLIGVNAPAVLVEVAFITNPEEEKKLASEEFRKQVAETLGGSLETYFRTADTSAPVPFAPSPSTARR